MAEFRRRVYQSILSLSVAAGGTSSVIILPVLSLASRITAMVKPRHDEWMLRVPAGDRTAKQARHLSPTGMRQSVRWFCARVSIVVAKADRRGRSRCFCRVCILDNTMSPRARFQQHDQHLSCTQRRMVGVIVCDRIIQCGKPLAKVAKACLDLAASYFCRRGRICLHCAPRSGLCLMFWVVWKADRPGIDDSNDQGDALYVPRTRLMGEVPVVVLQPSRTHWLNAEGQPYEAEGHCAVKSAG